MLKALVKVQMSKIQREQMFNARPTLCLEFKALRMRNKK